MCRARFPRGFARQRGLVARRGSSVLRAIGSEERSWPGLWTFRLAKVNQPRARSRGMITGVLKPASAAVVAILAAWTCSAAVGAQGRGQGPRAAPDPAPRWPDGRINLGAPPGDKGVWERPNKHLVVNPRPYQPPPTRNARVHIDQVPLQPWARALTNERHASGLASEPYTRCKPAGGPRQFMSPYGLEIVHLPEAQRVYVFNTANANSFRVIHMDGRGHPANLTPGYFGHS